MKPQRKRHKVHCFDTDIADQFGVNVAVLIHHFQFWLEKNASNNHNFHKGRFWTHNTLEAFTKIFTYLSKSQLKRLLKKMVDEGIILKDSFNKSGFDRTNWYAFTDEWAELLNIPQTKRTTREAENVPERVHNRPSTESLTSHPTDESAPSLSYIYPSSDPNNNPDKTPTAPDDAENMKTAGGDVYVSKKGRKLTGKRLTSFLMFWEAFDYKKGKAEAADAWIDIPSLTDSLVTQVCEAAKHEAVRRTGIVERGNTPKMAQGWLSGRRWEDEDVAANQATDPSLPHFKKIHDYVIKFGWEYFETACEHYEIQDPDNYRAALEKINA
ncbi:hypothetical protein [Maridesulfovibrio sp.]|uniref:hypothetical protein n=1 Tax=Maridesulfovibrio sp. TaxID=2795000 RepID=UPI003BA8E769